METDALLAPVLEDLDQPLDGRAMAGHAAYSRFHFHRMFRRALGEAPGATRRRLRMEKAAWRLARSETSVTEIAFDAGYASLEAFSRAFHRAYGVTPSLYRRISPSDYRLPAPNGVHYSPAEFPVPGGITMDILDRLLNHDENLTAFLLEKAKGMPGAMLDKPLGQDVQLLCYEPPQKSLRDLFHALVMDKEAWLSVLKGWPFPENADKSVEGLCERVGRAYPAFRQLASEIRDEGKWDQTFVDHLCSPPTTFPYGGMLSFVLFCGAHRLQLIMSFMRSLGINVDFGVAYGQLMTVPEPAKA